MYCLLNNYVILHFIYCYIIIQLIIIYIIFSICHLIFHVFSCLISILDQCRASFAKVVRKSKCCDQSDAEGKSWRVCFIGQEVRIQKELETHCLKCSNVRTGQNKYYSLCVYKDVAANYKIKQQFENHNDFNAVRPLNHLASLSTRMYIVPLYIKSCLY